ncbi:MAG: sugar porter family MFS transporter [Bacteroidales bacterium]|nr:sugar porter family MFS transporter [Bacteroidales bacterium]
MKLNLRYVLGISLVSALGGFLFGYDWVVIGGAKPFYERFFALVQSPGLQGLAMSSALIGCIGGAGLSGWFGERFGRKGSLMLAALLFVLSALGTGAVGSFTAFMAFRIAGGFGIGIASAISPIYISEVSPAKYRGRLVTLNQLNIVVGILAAQIINYLIAQPVPEGATEDLIRESWNGQIGWRWMFWAEAVPALLFFLLLFFIPESPRWLIKASQKERAERLLEKIGGASYALQAGKEISQSLRGTDLKVKLKPLLSKGVRPIVIIGILLAVFQQWCGINVVFNYAEEVFSAAGYEVSAILFNIVITGVVNLVFCLVALRTVDRWGRRRLMLIGSAGLTLLYLVLGISYFMNMQGMTILVIVLLCIAVYAMTLAPVTWVVLSEIFPNRVRGVAMAVATTMLWVASSILVISFPYLNRGLNAHGTFWLYAGICLAGFLFIRRYLPETKGKSLEEIEKELISKND